MAINSESNRKSVFTEWLEKLQQESWQLELLISGLALFGIWESRPLLLNFEYYIDANAVNPYNSYLNIFVKVLWAGWGIFMINLLIHIIVRALWIGAIGLRYVSGDIDYDELNYSDQFRRYFKNKIGSFDDYIEKLEKMSSVLFSFTFLLFFMFFSFVFANIVFAVVAGIINNTLYSDTDVIPRLTMILGGLFYGLGLLVCIDFVSLGGFKKVKDPTFSKIYFWIYRFYSLISLSAIYRPLLLNFIDNKYTKRLFFLSLPYILFLTMGIRLTSLERYSFIPGFSDQDPYTEYVDKYSINWKNYDDLRRQYHETFATRDRPVNKTSISIASLDHYEVSNKYLKLFLKYERSDSRLLERQHPDISVFRSTGIRHSIFSDGHINDPSIEKYKKDSKAEIRTMLKVVKGQEDELDSTEIFQFKSQIPIYQNHTKEDIPKLRKEIIDKYIDLRIKHAEEKIQHAQMAILANYEIKIDNISYVDSLSCSFYTHPNKHERGLLCLCAVDSLNIGEHMIEIEKTQSKDECINDCPTELRYIPFLKVD